MSDKPAPKDPLQGVTLEALLNELVAHYGWPQLGRLVKIRCFNSDPSIKSSLTFLRRTPWARAEVEALYTNGPAGGGGSQSMVREVVAIASTFIDRDLVSPSVVVEAS